MITPEEIVRRKAVYLHAEAIQYLLVCIILILPASLWPLPWPPMEVQVPSYLDTVFPFTNRAHAN